MCFLHCYIRVVSRLKEQEQRLACHPMKYHWRNNETGLGRLVTGDYSKWPTNDQFRRSEHTLLQLFRGGGGSYFPYILLNGIETMFSQLAKQSHWILSADCSIAHEHIRPVDLPVNTFSSFPTETEKMAVEGKSLALLLVSYFLLRKKFSLLTWTLNLDNCMCERSIAVQWDAVFVVKARFPCLGCRIVTNSWTCVSLIHFTKLLNKKNWRKFEGFICRF